MDFRIYKHKILATVLFCEIAHKYSSQWMYCLNMPWLLWVRQQQIRISHRQLRIDSLLIGMPLPAFYRLSTYVAPCNLTVVPQSSAKHQFHGTCCYKTLNSNCEAQRVSNNKHKNPGSWVRSQINNWVVLVLFFPLQGEKYVWNQLIKSNNRVQIKKIQ